MFIWGQAWSRESYSPGMMKGDADQNMATTLSSISDQDHGCNLSCLKAMAYGQLSLLVIDWICIVTHWFALEELFVWLVWLWTLICFQNLHLTFKKFASDVWTSFWLWTLICFSFWNLILKLVSDFWNLFLWNRCYFSAPLWGVTFLHL